MIGYNEPIIADGLRINGETVAPNGLRLNPVLLGSDNSIQIAGESPTAQGSITVTDPWNPDVEAPGVVPANATGLVLLVTMQLAASVASPVVTANVAIGPYYDPLDEQIVQRTRSVRNGEPTATDVEMIIVPIGPIDPDDADSRSISFSCFLTAAGVIADSYIECLLIGYTVL